MKYKLKDVKEFLKQSNLIEREESDQAMKDAMVAWKYANERTRSITTNVILGIHKRLCKNIDPEIAGKFRQQPVYIGFEKKPFISDELLLEKIKDWVKTFVGRELYMTDEDCEKICKDCHLAFEGIHPFLDGNGRTGRILYNVQRFRMGLPIHIIHTGWEQYNYYQAFDYRHKNPFTRGKKDVAFWDVIK